MPEPLPPRPTTPQPRPRSWFTIFLAGLGLMAGAFLLLLLPTGFIGPVIVFGGITFVGVIGFHYLVWGRWLNRILEEERRKQEEGDRAE